MRNVRLVAVVALGVSTLVLAAQQPPAVPPAAPGPVLSAQRLDDRIIVRVDDRTFTCYRFGAGQKYPYFYPVNGPLSGVSVTTESSLPWPHHRSLFFGSDKVNGGNYWQEGNEEGQIVSRGPTVVVSGPDRVEITDAVRVAQARHGPDPDRQARDPHRGAVAAAPDPPLPGHSRPADGGADREDQPLALRRPSRPRAVRPGRRRAPATLRAPSARKAPTGRPPRGATSRGRASACARGSPSSTARRTGGTRRSGSPATTASSPPRPSTGSTTRGCASPRARRSSSSTWSSSTPATPRRRGSPGSSRSGPRSEPGRLPAPRRRHERPAPPRWNSFGVP